MKKLKFENQLLAIKQRKLTNILEIFDLHVILHTYNRHQIKNFLEKIFFAAEKSGRHLFESSYFRKIRLEGDSKEGE